MTAKAVKKRARELFYSGFRFAERGFCRLWPSNLEFNLSNGLEKIARFQSKPHANSQK
jgi:hypothetical protein